MAQVGARVLLVCLDDITAHTSVVFTHLEKILHVGVGNAGDYGTTKSGQDENRTNDKETTNNHHNSDQDVEDSVDDGQTEVMLWNSVGEEQPE